MTATQTITTDTGRTLYASAAPTGRNFGFIGVVKAGNHRTIATTDAVYPFEAAALDAAVELAQTQ